MTHTTDNNPPRWEEAKDRLRAVIQSGRWGILTDVDGTISSIVDVPDEAQVSPRIKQLLAELHEYAAVVAAVSGRAAADIQQRVGVPGLIYIGNHGFERWSDGALRPIKAVDRYLPALASARRAVEALAPKGMWVEDKGATLSVHYRQTADPAAVAREVAPYLEQISRDNGLKLFRGRMIFELRPPIECHKGTAAAQLVEEFELDGSLFMGDDVTDVDAMTTLRSLAKEGRVTALNVGVQSDDMPSEVAEAADCLADGVAGVEALLLWFLNEARASLT